MSRKLIALACVLLLPSAQAADSEYSSWTYGAETCGVWLDSTGEKRLSLTWWVAGFVSSAGVFTAGGLKKTDYRSMAAYVDKYCRENPLRQTSDAALALVLELLPPPKK